MNCLFCGKAIRPAETECPYCGTPVPEPSDARIDPAEWLEQVKQLKDYLRHRPSPLLTVLGLIVLMVVGIALAYFCILFIPGEHIIFKIVLLIFVLPGGLMVVVGAWGLWKVAFSRFERVPALVVAKREHHLGDENPTISYYLTLKTEDGRSKEHLVRRKLFAELNERDVGIAYFKGYLMDFKRVGLPKA